MSKFEDYKYQQLDIQDRALQEMLNRAYEFGRSDERCIQDYPMDDDSLQCLIGDILTGYYHEADKLAAFENIVERLEWIRDNRNVTPVITDGESMAKQLLAGLPRVAV